MEWTLGQALTVLQARPIVRARSEGDRFKPNEGKLQKLRKRVADELIPALEAEGEALAGENLESLSDKQLAAAIKRRQKRLAYWRGVYEKDFIPFAHGVRRFGAYYAAQMRPKDPFEFVRLLGGEKMRAGERNAALEKLAGALRKSAALKRKIRRGGFDAAPPFAKKARSLLTRDFDVEFGGQRLSEREDLLVEHLLSLAERPPRKRARDEAPALRKKFLAGSPRKREAKEVLETARVSWRLRDDDNLLLGRIESQLLRAISLGGRRRGCRSGLQEEDAERVVKALSGKRKLTVRRKRPPKKKTAAAGAFSRQIVGQPASPGLAQGTARVVSKLEDLGRFRAGEILVCDAIQPNMTHIAALASAIVERRGGMLIHGSIIARELGIPCVNGVDGAAERIKNGDAVAVDGNLGVVTIGEPEMSLEGE
jgi:pyruvate,water dikinase